MYKGKKMDLGVFPLLIHPQPHRARMRRLKTLLEGRRQWTNHQFTSSLHAFHAKGQKWQILPWLDLCSQETWGVALTRQRDAPSPRMPFVFHTVLDRALVCFLSHIYHDGFYNSVRNRTSSHLLNTLRICFLIPLKLNRCRGGRANKGKPFSTQSYSLVTSHATSVFFEGKCHNIANQ